MTTRRSASTIRARRSALKLSNAIYRLVNSFRVNQLLGELVQSAYISNEGGREYGFAILEPVQLASGFVSI